MSKARAYNVAEEAMMKAMSVEGDRYTTLAQARLLMDADTTKPSPPIKIIDEVSTLARI